MRRYAVDKSAEDYWTEYFGEYGSAWVRSIPRRVSAALKAKNPRLARASIEPFGVALTKEGGVTIEGYATVKTAGGTDVQAFLVNFDKKGRVIDVACKEA